VVAVVVAAALIAGAWWMRGRAGEPAAPAVIAAPAPANAPPVPVVSEPRPRLDDEAADEAADDASDDGVAAVASARIDGVTYATEYARDMCACTDGACVDAVNERHGSRLGRARATRNARAVSAEFRRAMACTRRIRGA
jgi:hypothetical protein